MQKTKTVTESKNQHEILKDCAEGNEETFASSKMQVKNHKITKRKKPQTCNIESMPINEGLRCNKYEDNVDNRNDKTCDSKGRIIDMKQCMIEHLKEKRN